MPAVGDEGVRTSDMSLLSRDSGV